MPTFTERYLQGLKPKTMPYRIAETAPRGHGRLIVKVLSDSRKELYFRQRHGGKDTTLKLGNFKTAKGETGLSLASAREQVRALMDKAAAGINVKVEKAQREREEQARAKLEAQRGTLGQLLDAYVTDMKRRDKLSWKQVDRAFTRYVCKPLPELVKAKANTITPEDIQRVLQRMLNNGVTREANKIRAYLKAAFSFAAKADYDPRNSAASGVSFNIKANPVDMIPRMAEYDIARDRVLNESELKAFWQALDDVETTTVVRTFLKVRLLLGGQRIEQLARTQWSDYDHEKRELMLRDPKGRGGIRDHLLPVSDWVAELFDELITSEGFIFSHDFGKTALHAGTASHVVTDISRAMGGIRFTAGDIRRTAETMLASIGVDRETRAQLLSHGRTSGVQAKHYDRYQYMDEKRAALVRWETHIHSLLSGGKTVVLRRTQAA